MELKLYWHIIWKRAWIPALLVTAVAVASLLTYQTPPLTYSTTMRFNIGVKPEQIANLYNYDGYYAWLSSEYLIDNLTGLVNSQDFVADINRHLAEAGSSLQISPGVISIEKQHRILRLNVTWPQETELNDIARAIVTAMEEDSPKYFPQSDKSNVLIQLIDQPSPPVSNPPSFTQRLDFPVRLLLALTAGVALAFLLDYLDDSVRGKSDLETLGIAVLAEVPKK